MKKIFALIIALMMVFSITACAAPAAEEAAAPATEAAAPATEAAAAPAEDTAGPVFTKIKESGKLVVGTEAQYAPYEFKDLDANFVGCDMWLAQQIADALGVTLEIEDMGFDAIIPAVQSGQVDMGIAAFTWTEERAQVIDFSNIYEQAEQLIVVKAENIDKYATPDDFNGQKMGTQKGTIQSLLVKSVMPDSDLLELDKIPELGMEVSLGNIEGLVVDAPVAESLIANQPELGLAIANAHFTPEQANFGKAIVMCQGNADLVAEVNKVVDKVVADGSFAKSFDEAVELASTLGIE